MWIHRVPYTIHNIYYHQYFQEFSSCQIPCLSGPHTQVITTKAHVLAEEYFGHFFSRDFNSFGSRRGNDAVMARGTFGNIRLVNFWFSWNLFYFNFQVNKLVGKAGPKTLHIPSNNILDVFDAAEQYKEAGSDLIVLAGKDYGCGSSRDWAAKGPFLLGVRAVIAESYERIHRSNLVRNFIDPVKAIKWPSQQYLGGHGDRASAVQSWWHCREPRFDWKGEVWHSSSCHSRSRPGYPRHNRLRKIFHRHLKVKWETLSNRSESKTAQESTNEIVSIRTTLSNS